MMEVQVILNRGSIKRRSPVAVRTATVQLLTILGSFQEEGLAKTEFTRCDLRETQLSASESQFNATFSYQGNIRCENNLQVYSK